MTEQDAKKKWCIHIAQNNHLALIGMALSGQISNADSEEILKQITKVTDEMGPAYCIASNCMMWRWQLDEKGRVVYNNISLMDKDRQGYCGLANKP